jgi:hypothetical protein
LLIHYQKLLHLRLASLVSFKQDFKVAEGSSLVPDLIDEAVQTGKVGRLGHLIFAENLIFSSIQVNLVQVGGQKQLL